MYFVFHVIGYGSILATDKCNLLKQLNHLINDFILAFILTKGDVECSSNRGYQITSFFHYLSPFIHDSERLLRFLIYSICDLIDLRS
ncbi:hypothetical protein D3C81_1633770 [compost metagenome]